MAAADDGKPIGYWLIKALVAALIFGLAIFDLQSTETVPVAIYALLATLAGGPEVAAAIRGGGK